MKFLINCLKGEAKESVSDLILSNANYKIAKKLLLEGFGDKKILVESLEAELFCLPSCNDNALALKKTVDKIEKLFRQLEGIGEDTYTSVMINKVKITSKFLNGNNKTRRGRFK
jgi:hypothetical protein